MFADVKANIAKTTRNKRSGGFSYKFSQAVPSKLEVNKKRWCIFHLILVGIPSILILSMAGGGGFIRQNLLAKCEKSYLSTVPKIFRNKKIKVINYYYVTC